MAVRTTAKPNQELDKEQLAHLRAVVERGARARWWRRRGSKARGFWYQDAAGARIKDQVQIERIKALALPPAWQEVRINPNARGRLQAVGVDTCGRVQYRYHSDFAAKRQQKKYAKIERFGERLPALRRIANEHIHLEGFPRERVLAIITRLINDLYFRVGSEESVQRYRTFGITTLRNHHLKIEPDGKLLFDFVGKHHVRQRRLMVDAELANLMQALKAIGGAKLFNYIGADGKPHPITPQEVNHYIKAAMGPEFSAKDFRTWHGSLLAAIELAEMGPAENERQAKKNIVQAVKSVAERLGNTPMVCRGCYIHPVVFERYEQGITLAQFRRKAERYIRYHQVEMEPEELALLDLFHAEPVISASPPQTAGHFQCPAG